MVTKRAAVIGMRFLAVALALTWIAAPSAHAGSGAVVVTGTIDAKQQTAATAAVTSALRQAKWSLVDASFSGKDVQRIQDCFQQEQPWSCLGPIANPKDIARLFLLELITEKPSGGIRMIAQLAGSDEAVAGFQKTYCAAPCSESALAQSASDLVNFLLNDMTARTGKTFIEVITEPPGAAVSIDGRQLGPSGQKFPAQEGRHRVLVQLSGYRDADAEVDVVDGETKRVELKLAPTSSKSGLDGERHHPPRLVQWSLIGGGAGLVIAGSLYSYATALDSAPPPGQPRDSEWLYNKTALAVAGIGGAVAVGGLIWLLLTPKSDSAPTVSLAHDGVRAGWSITF